MNVRARLGTVRPMKPMKVPDARVSTAQLLQPRLSSSALHLSISWSLPLRDCRPGKKRITRGSTFRAAYGSRSSSFHCRSRKRSEMISIAILIGSRPRVSVYEKIERFRRVLAAFRRSHSRQFLPKPTLLADRQGLCRPELAGTPFGCVRSLNLSLVARSQFSLELNNLGGRCRTTHHHQNPLWVATHHFIHHRSRERRPDAAHLIRIRSDAHLNNLRLRRPGATGENQGCNDGHTSNELHQSLHLLVRGRLRHLPVPSMRRHRLHQRRKRCPKSDRRPWRSLVEAHPHHHQIMRGDDHDVLAA
ncbi:hypothetical protein SAMN05444747_1186 [Variovorax sp. OV329]|nr:hypothetical protein SAMN05444747_1186 [Variovorax sp. OV329]